MVNGKVYCRFVGEHSQKQGLLGESRVVDMTRLSCVPCGRGGTKCSCQEAKDTKRGRVTTVSGLYREGQPSFWVREFRAESCGLRDRVTWHVQL